VDGEIPNKPGAFANGIGDRNTALKSAPTSAGSSNFQMTRNKW
jgi:hypothetical protein